MKIFKIAKRVNGHSYSWVYINLPKDVQKTILALGKEIDPEDLFAGEAENGLEKDPHITVKYGLTIDDQKAVRECLEGEKGGNVTIGKSSIFECDEYDVVKLTVTSKTLERLHTQLNCLPHNDKHPEYKPHATIAYVKKGMGKKYDNKFSVNVTFEISECYFGNNERNFKVKLS